MEVLIARRQEDAGMRPLPDAILSFRAISYLKHLQGLGVTPEELEKVYELAVSIYNDTPPQGPFGIDHLVQAAKRLKEAKKDYVVYEKPALPPKAPCKACRGTRFKYKFAAGRVIGIDKDENGNYRKCEECENDFEG